MTNNQKKMITTALALGAALVAIAISPTQAPAQVLSGFDIYRTNCDGCHDLYDPENPKRDRKEWEEILTRMVKERGASLNPKEFGAVLNYLDSFNRPRREIRWVDAPARSHKASFLAADAGKLPLEWVDLTVGSDEQIPWAVQSDAASKTVYVSPLKAAAEAHFPALIDNTGTVRNGAATARMQLLSGTGAVGAGIVFGFRNPQAFYGVRISPRDVVLYEVTAGQRALLARAPVALPLKQWHTLGLEVDGQNVTVNLNGKPLPALTRAITGYQGGRLGLHTQGDTVALFDQWQVTVK